MPDGAYHGDEAVVLPSNTEALLHFSNLFAQQEQQRRASKQAIAKADEDRRIRVQKYLGDRLNNKDFETNSTYSGIVTSHLQDISEKSNEMLLMGVPEDQVMNYVDTRGRDLRIKTQKVNELDKNIATGIAAKIKADPTIDPAALVSASRHDATYKQDENGNIVPNDINTELDPTHDWVNETYNKNPELYHTADGSNKALNELFDKKYRENVGEDWIGDKNHNTITPGFKGTLPPFVTTVKNSTGHTVYENGSPKIDIAGSGNYRMEGENHDYVDENGKNVKVISDEMWDHLPNAVKAPIIGQVKQELAKVNVQGEQISPDSEYANMLKKNIAYQTLLGKASEIKFAPVENKSSALKHQAFSEQMARAHLQISQTNSNRAQHEFDWRKANKAAGRDENNPVVPLTDKYEKEKSETIINPLTGKPLKYIDINNIDKGALKIIAGDRYKPDGTPATGTAEPYTMPDGKKYFLITDDGDWYGKDMQLIDRDEAYKRQLHSYKKGDNIQTPTSKKLSIAEQMKLAAGKK